MKMQLQLGILTCTINIMLHFLCLSAMPPKEDNAILRYK